MPPRRPRLTYANVVSTLALFIALVSGAWAGGLLPVNSVGKSQIRPRAVGASELAPATVQVRHLSPALLTTLRIGLTPNVPPKSNNPCEVFGGNPDCINIQGKTKSVGLMGTSQQTLFCPSGKFIVPGAIQTPSIWPSFTVTTSSHSYTGTDWWDISDDATSVTNWRSRTKFTPYIGCQNERPHATGGHGPPPGWPQRSG
jgi:hypothetical protein